MTDPEIGATGRKGRQELDIISAPSASADNTEHPTLAKALRMGSSDPSRGRVDFVLHPSGGAWRQPNQTLRRVLAERAPPARSGRSWPQEHHRGADPVQAPPIARLSSDLVPRFGTTMGSG